MNYSTEQIEKIFSDWQIFLSKQDKKKVKKITTNILGVVDTYYIPSSKFKEILIKEFFESNKIESF